MSSIEKYMSSKQNAKCIQFHLIFFFKHVYFPFLIVQVHKALSAKKKLSHCNSILVGFLNFFLLLLCNPVDLIFIGSPVKKTQMNVNWQRNTFLMFLPLIGWSLSQWIFWIIYSNYTSLAHIDF